MNDSFRYWQGKKSEHAGAVSNLSLTLAIGSIGFALTLFEKGSSLSVNPWSPIGFILALVALLLSTAFAFLGMASRLEDFGATAQAARLRDSMNHDEARLAEERAIAREAGTRTKLYLTLQLVSFVCGIALLAWVVVSANEEKLFGPRPKHVASRVTVVGHIAMA